VAVYFRSDNLYNYYGSDTNGYAFIGSKISGLPRDLLVVPEKIVYFPISYNSHHYDSSIARNYYEYDTFTCDGYGTLMLPVGSFANVLRVHKVIVGNVLYADSLRPLFKTESYSWYMAGFHSPLLTIGLDSFYTGSFHVDGIAYYTRTTLGLGTLQPSSFAVYPNPASNEITIEQGGLASRYTITNCTGVVLLTGETTTARTQIGISGLPAGTYFLRLTDNTNSEVLRFVKQ
jgi:hypothetical protein